MASASYKYIRNEINDVKLLETGFKNIGKDYYLLQNVADHEKKRYDKHAIIITENNKLIYSINITNYLPLFDLKKIDKSISNKIKSLLENKLIVEDNDNYNNPRVKYSQINKVEVKRKKRKKKRKVKVVKSGKI